MKPIQAALGALAVIVIGLGVTAYFVMRPGADMADLFAQCRESQIAGGADQIGGPFTLINTAGETVTDQDVFTKPSILYFGYTLCPDICPADSYRNALAVDALDMQGIDANPVFISIDPDRDTPEVVADFIGNLHEKYIGLTGSDEQVADASKAYKTFYRAHDKSDEYYLVDHSTFTYLVLPEHGFVEYFRRDVSPEAMAERTACFVEAAS